MNVAARNFYYLAVIQLLATEGIGLALLSKWQRRQGSRLETLSRVLNPLQGRACFVVSFWESTAAAGPGNLPSVSLIAEADFPLRSPQEDGATRVSTTTWLYGESFSVRSGDSPDPKSIVYAPFPSAAPQRVMVRNKVEPSRISYDPRVRSERNGVLALQERSKP